MRGYGRGATSAPGADRYARGVDPFARRTFLQTLPGRVPETRFSAGQRLRAAQLQAFVGALHRAAERHLGALEPPALVVLAASDWRALLSAPYGWPLTRRTAGGVSVVAPADYPNRLLRRWDAVLLRAASAGRQAPTGVRALMDALVGLEWAHAALYAADLRSRAPWLNEVLAVALWCLALEAAGQGEQRRAVTAWGEVQRAGAPPVGQPTAFVYPRGRAPFDALVWQQGQLAEVGEALAARGWGALRGEVSGSAREAVARAAAAEPALRGWAP